MPTYSDDKKLVKRLLAHDEQAFTEFFDGYFPRLYRFVRIRLNDDPEASKEVVQAAFSKAIRKLHTYRAEAALFTWLCTVCRSELSEFFRRQARDRKHLVLTEDFPDIQAAVDSYHAPQSDDPHENFQRLEISRLIQVALDRLPTHYGDVLEWKYIYGYSVKEIADKLGLGKEAAHSLLARAKRAFHEVYGSLTRPVVQDKNIRPLS